MVSNVHRKDSMKHGQKKIHKTYLFTILVQSVLFLSPNLVNNS